MKHITLSLEASSPPHPLATASPRRNWPQTDPHRQFGQVAAPRRATSPKDQPLTAGLETSTTPPLSSPQRVAPRSPPPLHWLSSPAGNPAKAVR